MNFKLAVKWAVAQLSEEYESFDLVDLVREYFNDNDIQYKNFDFNDLKPYL